MTLFYILAGEKKYSDKQIIFIARCFIVAIVALTYVLAMMAKNANVFDFIIWCFSGFSALFLAIFATLYWKRTTSMAIASIVAAVITWFYYFHLSGYGASMLPALELFQQQSVSCFSSCFGCGLTFYQALSDQTLEKFSRTGVNRITEIKIY